MIQSAKSQRSSLPRPYSPFDSFFRNNFLDMWNPESIVTVPSVNIKETKDSYHIEMAVPGMKKEDFDIDIADNIMTISCEKETENKEDTDEKFSKREYNYARFSRSFAIPQNANSNNINARYADGVLLLTILKKADGQNTARPKIKIQ